MAQKKKKAKANALPQNITNPAVVEAIQKMQENANPVTQNALNEALKAAKLLSPVQVDIELKPGSRMPKVQNSQIKFIMLNTADKKSLFPAFTDLASLEEFMEKSGHGTGKSIVRTIGDYDKMLSSPGNRADGIVLNPGRHNMIVPRRLIGVLNGTQQMPETGNETSVPAPQGAPAPVKVTFSEPAVYPTRMVMAVYDACAQISEVSRVWLKAGTAAMTMSYYLFVEADDNRPEILEKIKETAVPLAKDVPVEMMFYTEKAEKEIIKGAFPLYDREIEI